MLSLFVTTFIIWNQNSKVSTENAQNEIETEEHTNPDPQNPIENSSENSQPSNSEQENETVQQPSQNISRFGLSRVRIGEKDYFFNSNEIQTVRPDLFINDHFSVFDIIVYLADQNEIELAYHFDETLNSHIIDSINGETGWWYIVYYSGGWPENNVFRPDHYQWKPGTQLIFYKESYAKIAAIYSVWLQEVQRKENNNGTIIIPEVIITGETFKKEFQDVEVSAHNLRNDVFQDDVITAIDVILSLSDQGKITYELQWYDYIGTANIVRSYWVDTIDADRTVGTCGFVYESGSRNYQYALGNHIHLPSDTRILNSPEYVEYFWICLDPVSLDNPTYPYPNQ